MKPLFHTLLGLALSAVAPFLLFLVALALFVAAGFSLEALFYLASFLPLT